MRDRSNEGKKVVGRCVYWYNRTTRCHFKIREGNTSGYCGSHNPAYRGPIRKPRSEDVA